VLPPPLRLSSPAPIQSAPAVPRKPTSSSSSPTTWAWNASAPTAELPTRRQILTPRKSASALPAATPSLCSPSARRTHDRPVTTIAATTVGRVRSAKTNAPSATCSKRRLRHLALRQMQFDNFEKHPHHVRDCGFDEYCAWTGNWAANAPALLGTISGGWKADAGRRAQIRPDSTMISSSTSSRHAIALPGSPPSTIPRQHLFHTAPAMVLLILDMIVAYRVAETMSVFRVLSLEHRNREAPCR